MSHALLTLVLAALVAQPKMPAAKPPSYVEIPLPEYAEQVLKSIQSEQTPNPPDLAKEVRDAAEKLRNLAPDDLAKELAKREDLQKLAREYLDSHKDLVNGLEIDPEDVRKFLNEKQLTLPKIDESMVPPHQRNVPAPEALAGPRQTFDQRIGKWLADWLQDEDTGGRFVEMMRDSPAFQDALDELLRSVRQVDTGWQPNLPDVPNGFDPPKLGEFPKFSVPEFGGGADWLPRLPSLKLPNYTMPAMFDVSGASLPEVSGDALQIAVAIMLVVGLILALRLWRTKTSAVVERPLVPMPVVIADGTDLRRAFEALALNRFGVEAKPWNHRLVAHRLGDGPAARELARLYEKIRYAPGNEPLSAADRESAGRSLAELAGGAV
jgi:hypothetical protein